MTYFAGELLKLADMLPADLAEMLRDYESELRVSPPGRWDGIGDPVQYECLAHHIGQSVTDGEWREGKRLDSLADYRLAWGQTRSNFERALGLLVARGEIAMRDGMYYPRPRNENS
jgi:hypothetical protein